MTMTMHNYRPRQFHRTSNGKIRRAITEIWIPQVWPPPTRPAARRDRDSIVRQLRSAWVTHLSTIFWMVVNIGQSKNSSRENPKFSAAILDFGGHLGFWHSRIKICLSWEPSSLKYHVMLLFIGFPGWQIQWWHHFGDSVQLIRATSISGLGSC